MSHNVDVITFGETMLRLSPPHHRQLSQTQQVDIHVGGSESNVAVGLAHLGVNVGWFSALPDNPLGYYVERAIHRQSVDTSHIHWSSTGRLGLYWVEHGANPRSSKVVYDREHTAISQLQFNELPKNILYETEKGILHLSGITPALSPTSAETCSLLMQSAKDSGWKISFDLNYRAKLWTIEDARHGCQSSLENADIIFAPLRDIQQIFGLSGTAEAVFEQFHQIYPSSTLVMTMGEEGAMASQAESHIVTESAFSATAIDPIGAGDAFVAGFLSQVVEQGSRLNLSTALRWANACAALKYTIVGDMPRLNRDDVIALINNPSTQHIQR